MGRRRRDGEKDSHATEPPCARLQGGVAGSKSRCAIGEFGHKASSKLTAQWSFMRPHCAGAVLYWAAALAYRDFTAEDSAGRFGGVTASRHLPAASPLARLAA